MQGCVVPPHDPPSVLAAPVAPAARAGCTARTALAGPAAPAVRFGSGDSGRVGITGAICAFLDSLIGPITWDPRCLKPRPKPKNSNP